MARRTMIRLVVLGPGRTEETRYVLSGGGQPRAKPERTQGDATKCRIQSSSQSGPRKDSYSGTGARKKVLPFNQEAKQACPECLRRRTVTGRSKPPDWHPR